jgi:hypothetical protein
MWQSINRKGEPHMKSFTNVVKTTSMLTAAFVFALATSVAAAPQRGGGGGRSGGGHMGGGGPRGHIIVGGGFYNPFWAPYYPYPYYGYGYPYWAYNDSSTDGSLKTEITPKEAQVYVDGYYAGVADDFDGAFKRLHATPGGHAITLHLEGYRTVTQNLYVRPDSTVKVKETMEKLAPGQVSEPVPVPPSSTGPSGGMTPPPDGGSQSQQ